MSSNFPYGETYNWKCETDIIWAWLITDLSKKQLGDILGQWVGMKLMIELDVRDNTQRRHCCETEAKVAMIL